MSDATERHTDLDPKQAAATGMALAVHARESPDRMALVWSRGRHTFDALNARVNRLVRALRARGLRGGDAIGLLCANRAEFVEALYAALRGGWRVTPINWHLTGEEVGYVVANCEARAFLADARFAEAAAEAAGHAPGATIRLAIGGEIPGFEAYDAALAEASPHDVEDPALGHTMLYTSGTTGRPKGVHRDPRARQRATAEVARHIAVRPGEDVNLCTGPLYHAAPLAFSLTAPLAFGAGVVLMDGWGAEESLRLVETHRVTHTHMVPTMFHRLLGLSDDVRTRYDVSSLRVVLHGAAPCPVPVKQALMDWLGPVVYEYYAATEGWGSFVTPDQWLSRPGTVGRPDPGQVEVRDDEGKPLPAGEIGTLYLKAPDDANSRFRYYGDEAKTAGAYDDRGGYFTLGDVGYTDADGWLYLCDRSADVIISGGVNIYPAEVDAAMLTHPAVHDVATVGIPNEEWGEEVRAVVELWPEVEPTPELGRELVAHCRERLAHYKCPRQVDFREALPRLDSGKIQRRKVREPYWRGRERRI